MKTLCKIFLTMLVACAQHIYAQQIVPVGSALRSGQVTFTANTSFDIGSIQDVFDGNPSTLARTPSVNPLVITLAFPQEFPLVKSGVISGQDADWTLEGATSLSDLDSQSGSYVKLADARVITGNVRDEVETGTNPPVKFVRLTLHRTVGDDYVHLNEWDLYSPVREITSISMCPGSYYLIPGYVKTYKLTGTDTYGFVQPVTTGVTWSTSDSTIATVNASGLVKAVATGTATISAAYQTLSAQGTVTVGNTYTPVNAAKKTVKVALLLEDPFIPGSTSIRWHERFGWHDPVTIANQLVSELNAASDNTVEFVIERTTYGDLNFTRFDGELVDSSFFYHRYETPEGREELLYWAGHLSGYRLKYDYTSMLNYYDYCSLRDSGEVDEVWIFSHPAAGMAESTLAGPNAFWYNSSPVAVSSCVKLLPIMGFNNEVNIDNALHSVGHRVESTMAHVYGAWNPTAEIPQSPFDLFTWLDVDHPGKSQVGNIHFTPNSEEDYDYGNTKEVLNFSDNWNQYPLIGNNSKAITCSEWDCSQLGYMRWWFGHLPKYQGINDGVLNDWWHYVVHYEDAVAAASALDPGCGNQLPPQDPSEENSLPQVEIIEPLSGATYDAPATIELAATTFDSDGFVTKVEFYQGTTKIGESVFAPFTFTWTNVPAGTYSITAKATDNLGDTATSAAITVTVNGDEQDEDLSGPSCANRNQTVTYTLDASLRTNAYSYSWWYNGYTQSITHPDGHTAEIQTGEWFGTGQVCVGVNYNTAPWYKSFCKPVSLCNTREGLSDETMQVQTGAAAAYPNPFSGYTLLRTNEEMVSVKVLNLTGQTEEFIPVNNVSDLKIGEHISSGIHTLVVEYKDGHRDVMKICKQ